MRGIAGFGAGALLAALMVPGVSGQPTASAATPFQITPVALADVAEISSDGRFLLGSNHPGLYPDPGWVILDRATGVSVPAEACPSWQYCLGLGEPLGFVADNPALRLVVRDAGSPGWYPDGGVFLANATAGTSARVDTDSAGAPLSPSWSGKGCLEDCDYTADPMLQISASSFSADGRLAAFCANYSAPDQPLLYVKDLVAGGLTRTKVRCGVRFRDDDDNPHQMLVYAPQVSADGRVVHVPGDLYSFAGPTTGWHADRLYFPASGKSRTLNGRGTMTRDGSTVLLSRGVHNPLHNAAATPGAQCAYVRATGKCVKLPWWRSLFAERGTLELPETAMTRRGRYLLSGSQLIDRRSGAIVDLGSLLRERGYEPHGLIISGDGKVIIASVDGPNNSSQTLALTGWGKKPMAVAQVATNALSTKLLVDIYPDGAFRKWAFRLQRQAADGTWQTLPTKYRAVGAKQTRTLDMPAGTYRVQVLPKGKYRGSLSEAVGIYR